MPKWGVSLLKPSILWPPPTDEQTRRAHDSLRSRIRQAISHRTLTPRASVSTMRSTQSRPSQDHPLPINIGSTTSVPSLNNETIRLVMEGGETLTIDKQVQLYTQNSLLVHPLVSPALSYLGGLPPLLAVAGDAGVLRDEIIYTYVATPHSTHRIFIIWFLVHIKLQIQHNMPSTPPPRNSIHHSEKLKGSIHLRKSIYNFTMVQFCNMLHHVTHRSI